ncbi:uncharacterized protein ACO6RY_06161 [Pungitius sinensis]
MTGPHRLLCLWVGLLLVAALCPGVDGKRGGFFKGRKNDDKDAKDAKDGKASSPVGRGLSKQGLKWAGAAAAAGMVGGTGTGLRLFGKSKHGSGSHRGHKAASSEKDQRLYHNEGQRPPSQPRRAFVKAAAPTTNALLPLGYVVCFLVATWMQDI